MVGSVNLPQQEKREAERRKAHLGNSRGLFPGSPGNRGTRQRLSTFRHGGVALVRASGDLALARRMKTTEHRGAARKRTRPALDAHAAAVRKSDGTPAQISFQPMKGKG